MKRILRILGYLAGAAVASAAVENTFQNLQMTGTSNELGAGYTFTLRASSLLTTVATSTVTLTNATVNYPVGQITEAATALANKPSCRAVATANVSSLSGTTTIDGIALTAGQFVLLTAQTTASQNGPWAVQASTWTRPSWYPAAGTSEAFYHSQFLIREGTANSGSLWFINTTGAITIDTTSVTITQIKLTLSSTSVQGTLPASLLPVGGVTDDKAAISAKPPVRAVGTANVTSLSSTTTIDGVSLVAGDLVLLTAQTTASQNGPWVVQSSTWTRPSWYPAAGTVQAFYGAQFSAITGTARAGTVWYISTTGAITIDTTSVAFTQRGTPASGVTAGSYGDATHVAQITVDAAGRVTTATNTTISGAGGGSGALIFLEGHTASSSATLDFTTSITSTYDQYVIEFLGVIPATNAATLWMRCSTNAGSTYDTTAIYSYDSWIWRAGGSALGGATAQAQIAMTALGVDNTAAWGVSGTVFLYSPLSTSLFKTGTGRFTLLSSATRVADDFHFNYESTTAVNAVRFLFSTGNIASGTIRIYGVAH